MNTFSAETTCREAWTAEGLSDRTIHAYVAILARAEALAAGRGLDLLSLRPTELRELAGAWPRTRASRIQLRVALGRYWAVAERPSAALRAVEVPRKPRYHCRALTEPEAQVLAAVARRHDDRAGLAVCLGLYAGLRREEIARLRWASVDLEAGWLTVFGKGGTTDEVPLHDALLTKLRVFARTNDYVFPGSRNRAHVTPATVWSWSRRLGREALGLPVATHRLRHTAIATLNDRTGDLRVAQAFARHVSPETTVLYTRVPRERFVEAVRAITYEESS